MNDKIIELRKQSGGLFHEGLFSSPGTIQFTEGEFDKFVELIIEECIHIGRIAYLNDNSTFPIFPSNQIKEHFGVE